ncbi:hypothetical protein FB192DRAFT_1285125 [Mucor lusitanicus]|uniref:C2H2-type domain-containing protein n=1 Tax=Mucor circinelloides f. lusitanicus TaxID=29924 RepID=A0A8H4BCY0_MUCCL|nr:hypothetical protein FB192DRAFT_1285125 [Mucor lusitanicus]
MPAVPSTATTNPPKKQRAKQKLFQCTGYDNCNMVFTRSEHLARHTRKHTGEKPYLCVVPGCTRRFSRFDNMMQHTQTHKSRSKSPAAASSAANTTTNTNTTTPPSPLLKELHLTQDEFEALQGFGRFKHTPIFIDSFRDLASAVYIDPNPVRN